MDGIPDIIAETATEYYKESFALKEYDGKSWVPAKKPKKTGSLMITSGDLMNSIHPAEVSRNRVVIQAGNDKVTYARVHNEGFTGPVTIPAHTRRTKKGSTQVKAYTIQQHIPQRQYMGKAHQLLKMIKERIDNYLEHKLNP